jgi:hypothetical protein
MKFAKATKFKYGYAPYEQAGRLLLATESSLLIERTADPSASLGITKGKVALPFDVLVVMTT